MVLMIDNYDSFTYNIVQYCLELGANLKVIRNDEMSVEQIRALNATKIILSPGPASPSQAGVSLDVVTQLQDEVPILGICLGHQTIAQAFGGTVLQAKNMMHGKTSRMHVTQNAKIFDSVPDYFTATRYHSLVVSQENLPSTVEVLAMSEDDHEIMALKVKDKPIYGVQFHPESIMSEYGHKILGNFLWL